VPVVVKQHMNRSSIAIESGEQPLILSIGVVSRGERRRRRLTAFSPPKG